MNKYMNLVEVTDIF